MDTKYGDVLETDDIVGLWFWLLDICSNVYGGFVRKDDDGLFIEDRGKKLYLEDKHIIKCFLPISTERFHTDC